MRLGTIKRIDRFFKAIDGKNSQADGFYRNAQARVLYGIDMSIRKYCIENTLERWESPRLRSKARMALFQKAWQSIIVGARTRFDYNCTGTVVGSGSDLNVECRKLLYMYRVQKIALSANENSLHYFFSSPFTKDPLLWGSFWEERHLSNNDWMFMIRPCIIHFRPARIATFLPRKFDVKYGELHNLQSFVVKMWQKKINDPHQQTLSASFAQKINRFGPNFIVTQGELDSIDPLKMRIRNAENLYHVKPLKNVLPWFSSTNYMRKQALALGKIGCDYSALPPIPFDIIFFDDTDANSKETKDFVLCRPCLNTQHARAMKNEIYAVDKEDLGWFYPAGSALAIIRFSQ